MNTSTYRCWAEIDRTALRHNAAVVRERIGSAELLAVVKANGYGHGMVGVAERATMLGGSHTVTSRPGAGTTIEIRFPVSGRPEHVS